MVGLQLRPNELPNVNVALSALHCYLLSYNAKVAFNNPSFFIHFIHLHAENHYLCTHNVTYFHHRANHAKEPIAARKTTLDAIAHYLGQVSWDALMGVQPADSDWVEKSVCADEIREGSIVEAAWLPDRELTLLCIGENRFRVTESRNGKLCAGDEVTIHHFRLDYPLEVSHIVRAGEVMCDADGAELCYIAGKQNGLKSFTIQEPCHD